MHASMAISTKMMLTKMLKVWAHTSVIESTAAVNRIGSMS